MKPILLVEEFEICYSESTQKTSMLQPAPNQLRFRKLFRKARIIGRRFQIVHVRMGPEIIEVTTFRGSAENSHLQQANASGMLVRDNVFGSVEDDAVRRDFTMNALYYDPSNHEILDFVGGYDDLEDGMIRIIGDPETRYREDPVRMLRAVRFVGKLGLQLEADTAEPIRRLAPLLRDVSPSRLFDEILKLLQAGHGQATFPELVKYDLLRPLFPQTEALLGDADELHHQHLIDLALLNTDTRLNEGKSVTPHSYMQHFTGLRFSIDGKSSRLRDTDAHKPLRSHALKRSTSISNSSRYPSVSASPFEKSGNCK